MKISIKTPLREFIEILKDRKWHNIYEFHEKYHLSAAEIYLVINSLLENALIEKNEDSIRFREDLNNSHLSILNSMQKTRRPELLDFYNPKHLTRSKKSV